MAKNNQKWPKTIQKWPKTIKKYGKTIKWARALRARPPFDGFKLIFDCFRPFLIVFRVFLGIPYFPWG